MHDAWRLMLEVLMLDVWLLGQRSQMSSCLVTSSSTQLAEPALPVIGKVCHKWVWQILTLVDLHLSSIIHTEQKPCSQTTESQDCPRSHLALLPSALIHSFTHYQISQPICLIPHSTLTLVQSASWVLNYVSRSNYTVFRLCEISPHCGVLPFAIFSSLSCPATLPARLVISFLKLHSISKSWALGILRRYAARAHFRYVP